MQLHNTSEIYEQLQWSEGGIVCTRGACQIAAMTPDSREMSARGQKHTCMRRLTMVGNMWSMTDLQRVQLE